MSIQGERVWSRAFDQQWASKSTSSGVLGGWHCAWVMFGGRERMVGGSHLAGRGLVAHCIIGHHLHNLLRLLRRLLLLRDRLLFGSGANASLLLLLDVVDVGVRVALLGGPEALGGVVLEQGGFVVAHERRDDGVGERGRVGERALVRVGVVVERDDELRQRLEGARVVDRRGLRRVLRRVLAARVAEAVPASAPQTERGRVR